MLFYSTNHQSHKVGFKTAVVNGLAPDKGLYFPESIPRLPDAFWTSLDAYSAPEIACEMLGAFIDDEISSAELREIAESALTFEIPLVKVADRIHCLELFHGPTLAFKDVGARFMGRILPHCIEGRKTVVLVATSGDTGAAVAHGFFQQPGIEVVVLYPKGKVSARQERQMACLGGNVSTLSVDGVFDDCQALVKEAFLDSDLNRQLTLTSANSINIARWLPQTIYYAIAYRQLGDPPVFCVPSGNYGNITAGMIAERMGMPVRRWIAASNANDVVPEFLAGSAYQPRPSVPTLANAMDVGDPSNFVRLMALFKNDEEAVRRTVAGYAVPDAWIHDTIRKIFEERGYLLDPHAATGYLALTELLGSGEQGIFLGTAHPAKFADVYKALEIEVEIPEALSKYDRLEVQSIDISSEYDVFREFLRRTFV